MQNLGLSIPDEFKISAGYTLTKQFNDLFTNAKIFLDSDIVQQGVDIDFEVKKMCIDIDKTPTSKIFSKKISQNILKLVQSFETKQAELILDLFENIEKLDLNVEIAEAQNIYFAKIIKHFDEIIEDINRNSKPSERNFVIAILEIGKKLNFNIEFYQNLFDRAILSDD